MTHSPTMVAFEMVFSLILMVVGLVVRDLEQKVTFLAFGIWVAIVALN